MERGEREKVGKREMDRDRYREKEEGGGNPETKGGGI